jgi:colicin import membrane protein
MMSRVSALPQWQPWMLSTVLHGLLLVALAGGVVLTRMTPSTETALALEAVVVDAATLASLQRLSAPRAVTQPAPEPAPEAAPVPKAAPVQEVAPAPEPRVERNAAPAAPASRAPVTVRPVTDTLPTPPAAAKAQPRPAPVVADSAARAAAAREAAERELQAALAEEAALGEGDRLAALRASGMAAQWGAAIRGRVQRAWIRPDTARSGIDCTVAVTQTTGGIVSAVEVRACNGDEAVRQSIEDAVRRASPLPAPPDPALFEREILLRFKPDA